MIAILAVIYLVQSTSDGQPLNLEEIPSNYAGKYNAAFEKAQKLMDNAIRKPTDYQGIL